MNYPLLCFVEHAVCEEPNLKSRVVINFDHIYNEASKAAIEQCETGRAPRG